MKRWWLHILRYAPRHRGGLALVGVLTILGVAIEVLKPWPLKLIVDHALKSRPMPEGARWLAGIPGAGSTAGLLAWLAAGTLLVFLLGQAVSIFAMNVRARVGGRMSADLGADLLDRVQRIPPGSTTRSTGDLVKRITLDTVCAKELILSIALPLVTSLLSLAAMFAVMWQLDEALAMIAIGAAIPMGVLTRLFVTPMARASDRQQELEGEMMALAEQTLTAVPLVQAFAREEYEETRFRLLSARTLSAYLRAILSQLQFKVATGAVVAIGTSAVMWVGGLRALANRPGGDIGVGDLLVVLAYLAALYAPLETLAYLTSGWATASAQGRRALGILDGPPALQDPPDPTPLPNVHANVGRHIAWQDVTFGYLPGTPVLHDVTLSIEPGKTLAIVGPTGAGKSTLVAMVPRLIDPWSGMMTIDGIDARQLRLAELRSQVSVVLQEPFLLPLSVAENIAYGRPGATRKEIEQAAIAANAEEFIRALPHGFDTVIGERGATLSGGQRQRLAIARALLKDAPLLILDEPTAALDAQTEQQVMSAIERLMQGRTCIVIAHRLSTVRRADRIAVLQDGRVVQVGSHDLLIAQDGLYRQLCQIQGIGPTSTFDKPEQFPK